jgi:hypothetical protein
MAGNVCETAAFFKEIPASYRGWCRSRWKEPLATAYHEAMKKLYSIFFSLVIISRGEDQHFSVRNLVSLVNIYASPS